ncbi:MAG: transcription antitermination factor NusB [Pseudomonadota bacterium]
MSTDRRPSGNRRDRADGPSPRGPRDGKFDKRRDDRRNDRNGDRDNQKRGPKDRRPPRKPEPEPEGLAARRAAVDLVQMVENDHTLDDALDFCKSFSALEGSDRSFARALAANMLRRRGTIDAVLDGYLDRPFPKRARRTMHILRCAAAQSLFLETPPHAAVSTAVALAKQYQETQGFAGVVNAVARRVSEQGAAALKDMPARIDTPAWMWRAWERHYGPSVARALAAAHQIQAPIDLSLKDPQAAAVWAAKLDGAVVAGTSVRLPGSVVVPRLAGYDTGDWWVQDAAAALPARLLGDVEGKSVFDLCAAPGGKTLQLAAAGGAVTAVDQSGPRLRRLSDNLERTGLTASVVESDVRTFTPDAPADAILLDAPCSATGTIRRHPDVLWTKTEEQTVALAKIQAELIDKAIALLKPGGTLVYCVCSLQPEEGERQAAAAASRPDLDVKPVTSEELTTLAGPQFSSAATKDGWLRTTPALLKDEGGVDGFFAARFVKSA